ncbi:MAG: tetratricopeptide repeat protein, partial [Planctomycetota bacterium]
MRILFLPFVTTVSPEEDPRQGVLTRALAREIAARVGRAGEVDAVFRPFAHMLDGKRVFGVYGERWEKADLSRLLADVPDVDFVVHGESLASDPVRLTVEVLRGPELESVAEETFEAPRFDGFKAVEGAVRFVLRTLDLPDDAPEPGEFPARTFEGYLHLLEGREASAALDGWGDTEDPAAAFEPFLLALDLEPKMEAAKEGLALLALAAALRGLAPLEAAESAVRKLLEIDRKSWRAWAALAQVRAAAGELGDAADAFKNALEIDPGRASLRYDLGMVYLRQDRAGRAAKILETVKADPHLGAAALLEL